MNTARKLASTKTVKTAYVDKKEGAKLIAKGIQHFHSSPQAAQDPLVQLTAEAMNRGEIPIFPWERMPKTQVTILRNSALRYEAISHIMSQHELSNNRKLCEKLGTVGEELITNAIFHSYRNSEGEEKYPRNLAVALPNEEAIRISSASDEVGLALSVTDFAGTLKFDTVQASFRRCYLSGEAAIETKESGAGLGFYMVYEMATHIKITVIDNHSTTLSCYFVKSRKADPNTFSFNYFRRSK